MVRSDIFSSIKVFRDEIPNAAQEVSYDESDDDHSYQFVEIKDLILLDDLFVVIVVSSKTF